MLGLPESREFTVDVQLVLGDDEEASESQQFSNITRRQGSGPQRLFERLLQSLVGSQIGLQTSERPI